jgi:hypothetical protein
VCLYIYIQFFLGIRKSFLSTLFSQTCKTCFCLLFKRFFFSLCYSFLFRSDCKLTGAKERYTKKKIHFHVRKKSKRKFPTCLHFSAYFHTQLSIFTIILHLMWLSFHSHGELQMREYLLNVTFKVIIEENFFSSSIY